MDKKREETISIAIYINVLFFRRSMKSASTLTAWFRRPPSLCPMEWSCWGTALNAIALFTENPRFKSWKLRGFPSSNMAIEFNGWENDALFTSSARGKLQMMTPASSLTISRQIAASARPPSPWTLLRRASTASPFARKARTMSASTPYLPTRTGSSGWGSGKRVERKSVEMRMRKNLKRAWVALFCVL